MESPPRGELSEDEIQKLQFFSGNPSVELIEGYVHLYAPKDMNTLLIEKKRVLPTKRSEILFILSVPVHMSPSDFTQFTSSFHKEIAHMRIIR